MFDPQCLEEDTYMTFEYLMKDLGYLFEYKGQKMKSDFLIRDNFFVIFFVFFYQTIDDLAFF